MDCQSTARGSRCLQAPDAGAEPRCVNMSCSESGVVLVDGVPCDPGAPPSPHAAPLLRGHPFQRALCFAHRHVSA